MIESIKIANVATYTNSGILIKDIPQINYIFGHNGCGKTTISRVIQEPDMYPECNISWKNNTSLETFVYNSDFIEKNFTQDLNGIFTLGKDNVDLEIEIERLTDEKKKLINKQNDIVKSINDEKHEIKKEEKSFKEKVWKSKNNDYYKPFSKTFIGFNNSKDSFFYELLKKYSKYKNCNPERVNSLKKKLEENYEIAFSNNANKYGYIDISKIEEIIKNINDLESEEILSKPIKAQDTVALYKHIENLNNSDWVHAGLQYLDKSQKCCPFCQQDVSSSFIKDIKNIFDKSYKEACTRIETLRDEYVTQSNELENHLSNFNIEIRKMIFLKGREDFPEKIENLSKDFLAKRSNFLNLLNNKIKNPSTILNKSNIDRTRPILQRFLEYTKALNNLITNHNQTIDSRNKIQNELKKHIWEIIISDLAKDIKEYNQSQKKMNDSIENKNNENNKLKNRISDISISIKEKEMNITSIEPTIDKINNELINSGFNGFYLKKEDNNYIIVRKDGNRANKTLSEGEKTFVLFLYFYFLILGKKETEKVIVIDDPVSSLDNRSLSMIGHLIKKITSNLQTLHISQIFILSHNIYFLKDITFQVDQKIRKKNPFWIVRKENNETSINRFYYNPIKSSYGAIWKEVKNAQGSPNPDVINIQNACRRILEHYFSFLGNINLKNISDKFNDQKYISICNSLIEWLHSGSHNIFDDINTAPDPQDVTIYLEVFRKIFEETGHISHYNMMMNLEDPKS